MTDRVMIGISEERNRQDKKWGVQNHHPFKWLAILGEEYGEACKAALEAPYDRYEDTANYLNYRKELTEVAAVAVAAIECLDRSLLR